MGNEILNVVLVQNNPVDCRTKADVGENIKATLHWMEKARTAYPDADLIVFCEFGIQGANPNPEEEIAFPIPCPEIAPLLDKCRDLGVWAAFNFQERDGEKLFNTSVIADDRGEIQLKYRKVNTFVPLEGNCAGDEFMVCRGPKGSVLGMLICYDGDFPEAGRELAYKGANVFLRMTGYMEPYGLPWEFTNRARAYENIAYVCACNRGGNGSTFSWFGRSEIVDYQGRVIAQAPAGIEWMTKAELCPAAADAARKEKGIFNHLYNIRHRGYTAHDGREHCQNPYTFYQNWE